MLCDLWITGANIQWIKENHCYTFQSDTNLYNKFVTILLQKEKDTTRHDMGHGTWNQTRSTDKQLRWLSHVCTMVNRTKTNIFWS